jgi:hypothetical protein
MASLLNRYNTNIDGLIKEHGNLSCSLF